MATIILRDAGSITSPGSTAKGFPLTNLEVDNNFSNINVTLGVLSNLTTTAQSNLVVAINELVTSNATQNTQITLLTSNIGVLSGLTTSNIGNLVSAVNELNANSGVAASTYGNATIVPVITVNAKGQITSAANATISLSPSGVTAATYGSSNTIPVIAIGADGRITNASNVTPTVDGTNAVGYRNLPQVGSAKTTSYTLAASDVGKFVVLGTSGTIVIPASVFDVGDAISVTNNTSGAIVCTSSAITAYLGGTNTIVTSFTLASRGVCTILFVTSSIVFITGNVT